MTSAPADHLDIRHHYEMKKILESAFPITRNGVMRQFFMEAGRPKEGGIGFLSFSTTDNFGFAWA